MHLNFRGELTIPIHFSIQSNRTKEAEILFKGMSEEEKKNIEKLHDQLNTKITEKQEIQKKLDEERKNTVELESI